MIFCNFGDTLYNLDKFIGVEVIDNSNDISDVISIAFRFEGDYQKSNDEENTPYSFLINMTRQMLELERINISDLESILESDIHDILRGFASEFVEIFQERLVNIPIDDNFIIDLGRIKRDIIKKAKEIMKNK